MDEAINLIIVKKNHALKTMQSWKRLIITIMKQQEYRRNVFGL